MESKNVFLSGKEAVFDIEELFYSVTDTKGIILDFNSVFQRISGYSEGELINSPHRIIRHPHMPRTVFYLMWQNLLSNKCFCGYVNNRAKNGDNYWVFAWVVPTKEYLISIRQRPIVQDIFKCVAQLYSEMLQAESKQTNLKDQIQAGYDTLLKGLNSLGFNDYEQFYYHAAFRENLARSEKYDLNRAFSLMKSKNFKVEQNLRELINKRKEITLPVERIVNFSLDRFGITKASEGLKQVSLNLAIRAKKMGDQAATLDCISVELRRFADLIQASTEEASKELGTILQSCKEFIWLELLGELLEEVIALEPLEDVNQDRLAIRDKAFQDFLNFKNSLLHKMFGGGGFESKVNQLDLLADRFLRFEKNLNFTTVCGRSESSRLNDTESFWALLDQVVKIAKDFNSVSFAISELQISLMRLLFRIKSYSSANFLMDDCVTTANF